MFWGGNISVCSGVKDNICAQRKKLCNGASSQTYLSSYDKNQQEICHSKELSHTYTGGWLILFCGIISQCKLPHFCRLVTLGMWACN